MLSYTKSAPDPETGWMDSKTVKLNCLSLGELENEPIFKKMWSVTLNPLFPNGTTILLTINKQHIRSLLMEKS